MNCRRSEAVIILIATKNLLLLLRETLPHSVLWVHLFLEIAMQRVPTSSNYMHCNGMQILCAEYLCEKSVWDKVDRRYPVVLCIFA